MVRIGDIWKSFTVELACWLEDMWKNNNKKAHLKDYIHVRKYLTSFKFSTHVLNKSFTKVDFDKMQMIRPFFGQLRRLYISAARFRCKMTSKNTSVYFKIHRIQVQLEFIYIQIKYFYNTCIIVICSKLT